MGCGTNQAKSPSMKAGGDPEEAQRKMKLNKKTDELMDPECERIRPDEDNFGEDNATGEQAMASKAYKGAIVKPEK